MVANASGTEAYDSISILTGIPESCTPPCTKRHRCRRIWTCQTCHNVEIAKKQLYLIATLNHYQESDCKLLAATLLLRPSVYRSLSSWEERQGHIRNVISQFFELRNRHNRRKEPAGFALIDNCYFYPHFRNKRKAVYPHFHGALAIRGELDRAEMVNWFWEKGVRIWSKPVQDIERWVRYTTGEFYEPMVACESKPGLTALDRGMALHNYGRRLLCETTGSRLQRASIKKRWEDIRWDKIQELSETLAPPESVNLLTDDPTRLARLKQIATLMKAAKICEKGECFSVPIRRLGDIIQTSAAQTAKDLLDLRSIGVITRCSHPHQKPGVYRYEESI